MPARVPITLSGLILRCRVAGVTFSRATFFRCYRKDDVWLERLDARQSATGITFDERAALDWILEQNVAALHSMSGERVGKRSERAGRFFRKCPACESDVHVRLTRCKDCGAQVMTTDWRDAPKK